MKILAFAEQRENKFKKSAYEVVQASKQIAGQLGAEHVTLIIGDAIAASANDLAAYGAGRVVSVQDTRLAAYSTTAYGKIFAEIVQKEQATMVFLPASAMGKDLAPVVAASVGAGVAADCIALTVDGGEVIATRPVYAGKATIDVRVVSSVKMFTLRPNVFTATAGSAGTVTLEQSAVSLDEKDFAARVTAVHVNTGRPDVTEAAVIVSGGRGLKAPEHFHFIEELADAFGGAVGASRAVVDAGWRPHEEQVGQTGKTVSPTLYVACGISGAVQHLAGMSSSKYIVAINKDKDAPIFQIADYGIVGDVFEVLPALIAEVKKATGK